jgi:predicted RNA-binding Zn-ribbon protein involved in translation (DUF1610 family)
MHNSVKHLVAVAHFWRSSTKDLKENPESKYRMGVAREATTQLKEAVASLPVKIVDAVFAELNPVVAKISCTRCNTAVEVRGADIGRTFYCPVCGEKWTVTSSERSAHGKVEVG